MPPLPTQRAVRLQEMARESTSAWVAAAIQSSIDCGRTSCAPTPAGSLIVAVLVLVIRRLRMSGPLHPPARTGGCVGSPE